jgi:hypothetical protein
MFALLLHQDKIISHILKLMAEERGIKGIS